ncbi:MAG: GNAT family N-acetyltransferase [Pseudomonadota bacterium]
MLKIFSATTNNLDQLTHLFDLYRQFYGQDSDILNAKQFLSKRLAQQESKIFIAELDGSSVGFVQLYPSFSSVSMQKIWILNDLFVVEQARKQGVANALMEKAKDLATETLAVRLELSTQQDNRKAQALYEKLGYVKDNEYYHYSLSL